MQRYIMRNRELFTMSHGQRRNEYIIFNEAGETVDRLEVTPSTARWLASTQDLKPASPMDYYQIVVCR